MGKLDSCRRRGFSLLEAVLVLAIVSILSAIAVPRYSRFSAHQRLDAVTRRILLDLTNTKRRAQLTSTSRRIDFAPVLERYTLVGLSDPDHPGQPCTIKLDAEPYAARLVSAQFGGDASLVFDGFGAPDTGGTVVVSVGSLQQTITVDGPTGRFTKLLPLIIE
jgi:prepilin-type N-terminal cleavage/methylation domain-containing protein